MPPKWTELSSSEGFKALPADQQEKTRVEFFTNTIAPTLAPEHLGGARKYWDEKTLPKPAAPAPNVANQDSNVTSPTALARPGLPVQPTTPLRTGTDALTTGGLDALKSGGRSTAANIGITFDAWRGDPVAAMKGVNEAREIPKTPQQTAFSDTLAAKPEDGSLWGAAKDVASAAYDEPTGALHEIIAQLPNSGTAMAGMAGGASIGGKIGSVAGLRGKVLGSFIGGVLGASFGTSLVETGGVVQDKAGDGSLTEGELSEATRQGAIKSTVIGAVDRLTMGVTGLMFGAAGKAATKAANDVLALRGVDIASDVAIRKALSDPATALAVKSHINSAVMKSNAIKGRTGRIAGAMGLETFSEGAGEYWGSQLAGLDASMRDAVLEGLMSMPQSALETLWSRGKAEGATPYDEALADTPDGKAPGAGPETQPPGDEFQEVDQPGETIITPPPADVSATNQPVTSEAAPAMTRDERQGHMAAIDAQLKVTRAEQKAAKAAGNEEAAAELDNEIRALAVNFRRVTNGTPPALTPRQEKWAQLDKQAANTPPPFDPRDEAGESIAQKKAQEIDDLWTQREQEQQGQSAADYRKARDQQADQSIVASDRKNRLDEIFAKHSPASQPANTSMADAMQGAGLRARGAMDEIDAEIARLMAKEDADSGVTTTVATSPQAAAPAATPVKRQEIPFTATPRPDTGTIETQEIPVKSIILSKDVPQFKSGANAATGVVEPLEGTFDPLGAGPILVWERANGDLELISGRHRFDLAQRSGRETIGGQIVKESEGFTQAMAVTADAELNIRDNQGEVSDYANYFKHSGISKEEAEQRGLLSRAKGRSGFVIASQGTDLVFRYHQAGQITDAQAAAIAQAAPGNEGLQTLGLDQINGGASIDVAVGTMQAVQAMQGIESQASDTGDMFAFDDSGLKKAKAIAKRVAARKRDIRDSINAVRGAANRPEKARAMGVDVKDPDGIKKRLAQLEAQSAELDTWPTNARLREELIAGDSFEVTVTQPEPVIEEEPDEPVMQDDRTFDIFGGEPEGEAADDKPAEDRVGKPDTAGSAAAPAADAPAKPKAEPAAQEVAPKAKTKTEAKIDDLDAQIDAAAAELAALLRPKPGTLNTGVDPQILIVGTKLGALYIQKGTLKFAIWAKLIIDKLKTLGIDPDQIKPHLKGIYAATQQAVSEEQADQMDDPKTVRATDLDNLGAESKPDQETDFQLSQETEAARTAREKEETAKAEAAKKAEQKAEEKARKEKEQADTKAAADSSVDRFELGQDADQQLSGQGSIFDAPPVATESYNDRVRREEAESVTRRLQKTARVMQENGKAFKSEASAKQFSDKHDLGDTHEARPSGNGFVLARLGEANRPSALKARQERLDKDPEVQRQNAAFARAEKIGAAAEKAVEQYENGDIEIAEFESLLDSVAAGAAEAATFTEEFQDEDGNTVKVTQNVVKAIRQMDKRLSVIDSLLGCLTR